MLAIIMMKIKLPNREATLSLCLHYLIAFLAAWSGMACFNDLSFKNITSFSVSLIVLAAFKTLDSKSEITKKRLYIFGGVTLILVAVIVPLPFLPR
jgi:hypothetical protein